MDDQISHKATSHNSFQHPLRAPIELQSQLFDHDYSFQASNLTTRAWKATQNRSGPTSLCPLKSGSELTEICRWIPLKLAGELESDCYMRLLEGFKILNHSDSTCLSLCQAVGQRFNGFHKNRNGRDENLCVPARFQGSFMT